MKHFEVLIVGGGISGAACFFTLARYTDVKSIGLVEKYDRIASLNSAPNANSQTIHCGDIETNYTFEKARAVRRTSAMIGRYAKKFGLGEKCVFGGQKMALGVGDAEVEFITKRCEQFKELYPYLEFFDRETLAKIEPVIVEGRKENIAAMGVRSGEFTTVDYNKFAISLVEEGEKSAKDSGKATEIFFNSEVTSIAKDGESKFVVKTRNGLEMSADFVIVNAGAHSLFLAHKMGLGKHFATICIAGSFYLTRQKMLNGKVYMVQNPKLPFAALHGDPDLLAGGCTRFGPTALAMPKLERFHGTFKNFFEFMKSLNFDSKTAAVLWDLMRDSDIRNYILRNIAFEMPFVNKSLFVKDARKIVPTLKTSDIYYAKGFGGVRGQIIDKDARKLMLGEASLSDGGAIFNMTPSPGATSCLGNAEVSVKRVCEFLGRKFDNEQFEADYVRKTEN